jgi:hypothetical protein
LIEYEEMMTLLTFPFFISPLLERCLVGVVFPKLVLKDPDVFHKRTVCGANEGAGSALYAESYGAFLDNGYPLLLVIALKRSAEIGGIEEVRARLGAATAMEAGG